MTRSQDALPLAWGGLVPYNFAYRWPACRAP